MKKILTSFMLLFVAVAAMAQQEAKVAELSMKSQFYDFERDILVYTPIGFDKYTATDYDVFYVFDAQERGKFDLVHCLMELGDTYLTNDRGKEFIIVGVISPYMPEIPFGRNTDFLPMPIHEIGKGHFAHEGAYGRSGDLKKFLKQELMPFIEKTYNATGRKIGVGHSLGASFVLDCMITDDLFDDYIALSPNCSYDEFRVASDLEQYPFKSHNEPRFIFAAMGDERARFGERWHQGWVRASAFLSEKSNFPSNTIVTVKNYPGYNHQAVYIPSLQDALNLYLEYSTSFLSQFTSQETYPYHIELQGEAMKSDVYITGNQPELANWEAKGIKMTHVNDTTCAIDLQLHLPAYFKFTSGDWEHEAFLENSWPGRNIIIQKPEPQTRIYRLEPEEPWSNE